MDPRKFLKRLARELGLLRNDQSSSTAEQKVSQPENFQHRVHVALDENSGGFVGLPPQWKQIVEKTKSDGDSLNENARSASGTRFAQRLRHKSDDRRALDSTYLRTSRENFASLAASLDTPRSRASVADSQDLIIERLKRELREYKARNPQKINESAEDVFGRSTMRDLNNASQSMESSSRLAVSNHGRFNSTLPRSYVRDPHKFDESTVEDEGRSSIGNHVNSGLGESSKNALSPMRNRNSNGAIPNHGRVYNSTLPRSYVSDSHEFDESIEDEVFPSQHEERPSISNHKNSAESSKNALSPVKNRNSHGAIPSQSLTKLNGLRANGNVRALRRSESEV